jgi:predicted PurR-regulated permease PerM
MRWLLDQLRPPVRQPYSQAPPQADPIWRRPEWAQLLIVELCVLVGLVLLYAAGQILQFFGHFLLLISAAGAIALFVAPAVQRLERAIGSRLAAAGLVYVAVLVAAVAGLVLVAVPLVFEAGEFARDLPRFVQRIPDWTRDLEGLAASFGITVQLTELAGRATSQLQSVGTALLGGTAGVIAGITSTLADVVLALVLSFYLSVDGPRLRDQVVGRLPLSAKPRAARFETSFRRVFGGYLRGQLILGLVLGVVAGVGAAALGLPYPVVIGVLAGVFELVPMFGSLIGAVPAILVALFQPFPTVLWVILFFIAVNQAENFLLAPRITGGALGLSALHTLVALLIGIEVAGFLGALVAVPVAALLVDLTKPGAEPA